MVSLIYLWKMKPIAYCTKNTKKQLLLSAVVSPKLMRESWTLEVWARKKNLKDNLFSLLGKNSCVKNILNSIPLVKLLSAKVRVLLKGKQQRKYSIYSSF